MVKNTEAIRFELIDPRDGNIGVKYSFKTREEMEQKADELGSSGFQGVTEDNEILQYVKKAGKWQRQDHRAEEEKRLADQFQSRIRADQLRDMPTSENLPSEVKAAFEVMGSDPIQDEERRASIAIEARHIEYADAAALAKNRTPDTNDKPRADVIPPEIAEQWAEIDARDFRKLTDEHRIEEAAIFMMGNAQSNAAYKSALTSHAPEIVEIIAELDAANHEKIALKEARKFEDARNMAETLSLDPTALDRGTAKHALENNAVREALGLNSIEPDTEKDKKAKRPATQVANGASPADNTVGSDEVFTATQADSKPLVPPAIEQRYLHIGDKFYHPKNTDLVAFEDKGNRLETKSNSESIAESMVQIAAARGWDEIKVSGTETFRKQAWLEAASRGMHVKGYSPSEQDKAELAKRARELPENKIENANAPFRARENGTSYGAENALTPAPGNTPGHAADSSLAKPVGDVLLTHGAAKYMHKKENEGSYYVTTRDSKGSERTSWGIDLKRAMSESGAMPGDKIVIVNEGRKQVTVTVPVRDDNGAVIGSERKVTHRNSWNVQLAETFAKESAVDAVTKHPELAGAVAAAAIIDKQAEAHGLTPEQRAIVTARVRQNVVNSIERGDIPEVRLKVAAEARKEVHKEREYSR